MFTCFSRLALVAAILTSSGCYYYDYPDRDYGWKYDQDDRDDYRHHHRHHRDRDSYDRRDYDRRGDDNSQD